MTYLSPVMYVCSMMERQPQMSSTLIEEQRTLQKREMAQAARDPNRFQV